MALTPAQLTTLRNDILADPALAAQPLNTDGAIAIAQAYTSPDSGALRRKTLVAYRT